MKSTYGKKGRKYKECPICHKKGGYQICVTDIDKGTAFCRCRYCDHTWDRFLGYDR